MHNASITLGRRQLLQWLSALALGARAPTAFASHAKRGQLAPPAVLVTLDGQRIATHDLLGQVVILTFWATYCVPCRHELPLLSDFAQRHAGDGLTVLGFCLDGPDQTSAVRDVAATLSFPVGFLGEDSAPGYGRIWRMPVNFTIARNGTLVENGYEIKDSTWTAERLDAVVTPLLERRT